MEYLKRLVWFAVGIVVIGLLLSGVAKLWVDLSWWKVFRRCASIAAVVMLWLLLKVFRQPLRSFGLSRWGQGRRQLTQGFLLGWGVVLAMLGLYLATGVCRIAVDPDRQHVWLTLLGFLPAAGLVAVLEEVVFRGYVLQHLLVFSRWLAVMASSAAYALVHMRPNPLWPKSAFELTGLFILGLVLSVSYLKTRQLYLAIGLHAGLAYWARVNKLVIQFPGPSLHWLVGSNQLVNGVVAWLALMGIGWIIARHARPLYVTEDKGRL